MAEIDAKAFLQQVELFDNYINNKLEELDRLKALTLKITTSLKQDVVSSSGSQDKLGDAVAKIVDLEAEINEAVDTFIEKKRAVSGIIEKVNNPDQANVLSKRYLLYERWEQIAMEMNFTYRHTTRIHGEALQTVRRLLSEERCL